MFIYIDVVYQLLLDGNITSYHCDSYYYVLLFFIIRIIGMIIVSNIETW